MLIAIAFLTSVAAVAPDTLPLTPAKVSDVVSAALNCFDAVTGKKIAISRLTDAGWVELLTAGGKPETPGGHVFRHTGFSGEIAVVGGVCSLVAPVTSFEDVKATLVQLDSAIHPDKIEENDRGILLKKGNRAIMFLVGNPTIQKPAAVRIDAEFSETQ